MQPSVFDVATVLLSVAGLWTVAVVTPGPNFFLTVQTAVGGSRRAALWSVLGTSCGTVVWGLSGFFGLALLFQAAPWLYGSLKLLGGAYLVYPISPTPRPRLLSPAFSRPVCPRPRPPGWAWRAWP